jgi:hypothetical protein
MTTRDPVAEPDGLTWAFGTEKPDPEAVKAAHLRAGDVKMDAYYHLSYTYEADHHCWQCAVMRFGRTDPAMGTGPDATVWLPANTTDSEGNPLGIMVRGWEEWCDHEGVGPHVLACGTCAETIATCYCDEDRDPRRCRCDACAGARSVPLHGDNPEPTDDVFDPADGALDEEDPDPDIRNADPDAGPEPVPDLRCNWCNFLFPGDELLLFDNPDFPFGGLLCPECNWRARDEERVLSGDMPCEAYVLLHGVHAEYCDH